MFKIHIILRGERKNKCQQKNVGRFQNITLNRAKIKNKAQKH